MEPTKIIAPDDSGSDTFDRYLYQAKVIFPFFLSCALGGPEISIIPEHIEDVLIEYPNNQWSFKQIKSRDGSVGYWTLSDLASKDSAPLKSLYRSFEVSSDVDATYELLLEQPLSPSGDVKLLLTPEGRSDDKLIKNVSKALKIKKSDCKIFLSKIRIFPSLPARKHIDAVNISLIQTLNKNLTGNKIENIYSSALNEIVRAMRGKSPGISWPSYIRHPFSISDRKIKLVDAKHITYKKCSSIIGIKDKKPTLLLERVLNPKLPPPTALESKLIKGGATEEIVSDAKMLRANAVMHEAEVLSRDLYSSSSGLSDDSEFQNVQNRLIVRTNATVAHNYKKDRPAIDIWNDLIGHLQSNSSQFDPNSLFEQDVFLLMGEICEISDQCITNWGIADA
ncbi:hypothetical protein BMS3Bbin08_02476 [bacterium BMS3Bbin08]|nr:hypothetical protein BMS3Bbin08_02476 [bacterium BMS3Bbin08]